MVFRGNIGLLVKKLFFKFSNLTRLKYGWFHLKLYSMFQDLRRCSIETGFWQIWDAAQIHVFLFPNYTIKLNKKKPNF